MRFYTYVVARDFGFAPNPFGSYCTLATCKPDIRLRAQIGDWIAGTGSGAHGRTDKLVYVMCVSESLSFDQYWNDPRFQNKKPNLRASTKLAFGDNIYHRNAGKWVQMDSHHSLENGTPNPANVQRDTKANRVLVASHFSYWGGSGPSIPIEFRDFDGYDICKKGPGYKSNFPQEMIDAFLNWYHSLDARGYLGRPLDW